MKSKRQFKFKLRHGVLGVVALPFILWGVHEALETPQEKWQEAYDDAESGYDYYYDKYDNNCGGYTSGIGNLDQMIEDCSEYYGEYEGLDDYKYWLDDGNVPDKNKLIEYIAQHKQEWKDEYTQEQENLEIGEKLDELESQQDN